MNSDILEFLPKAEESGCNNDVDEANKQKGYRQAK